MSAAKQASLGAVVLLTACSATLPVYRTGDSGNWVAVHGAGNPFVLKDNAFSVEARVLGTWAHARVRLILRTEPAAASQLYEKSVELRADNGAPLELERKLLLAEAGELRYWFVAPGTFPSQVRLSIEGLPALDLSVTGEKCRWYGDSYANYFGCSDAARSADSHE